MIKLFNFENSVLTLNTPELLLVKEFKAIWDDDPSKSKEGAYEMFKYIWLTTDWASPYIDFEDKDKISCAKKDCDQLTDKDFNSKLVKDGIAKYKSIISSNILLKMYGSIKSSVKNFLLYFENIDFTEKITEGANKGKLLHSVSEYTRAVKEASSMMEEIKQLEKSAIEELKNSASNARGDMFIGYDD